MDQRGAARAGGNGVVGQWRADFPAHAPEALFAIAADIESYPRFVPWCIATRILARHPDHWRCDNLFGTGPVRLRFHTRAEFDPPKAIDITSGDGPFRDFRLSWRFLPLAPSGCRVECGFAMTFRRDLLGLLARVSLPEVERRILNAFRARAETLQGGRLDRHS